MQDLIDNLVRFIKSEKGKIAIITHANPDGDAIGSLMGLYLYLKKAGKRVVPVLKDRVPSYLDFVPSISEIKNELEKEFDTIILVDASEFSRTGIEEPPINRIIRIDHHISGKKYSDYDVVVPEAPSTASLILEFAKKYDERLIDSKIKTCIYTGLLTDTASFRHSNSFKWAFSDAYYLVSNGLDVTDIASLVYERKKLKTLKLLGKVLSEIFLKDGVAFIVIKRSLLEELGLDRSETEGFVNYPLSVDQAIVGVSVTEIGEKEWRISLRGKNKVNLAKVAETFGGGGHFNAAGCSIRGELDNVINLLVETINTYKIEKGA
ncbi:MAG: bifunctional oligoribonuclease/PAP phosphatase NrnA [candidate division WOR-3 bacterium]